VCRRDGFDRPGVLVRLVPGDGGLACTLTTGDDVTRAMRNVELELWSEEGPGWAVALVTHRREFIAPDAAAGVVRAELSIYENIQLDVPPRNLGIIEATRAIAKAGEVTALALRAVGCPIGPRVRERPEVEHPDLYRD
jgi:hypothetical protein